MLAKISTCIFFAGVVSFWSFSSVDVWAASIVGSKHDLTVDAAGNSSTEKEVCVFCHIPHNAGTQAPLWSREDSNQIYIPYTSTTVKAVIGQPTGASKLCLSCHDGTVALGMVKPLSQGEVLGTDLSDDHPVSFVYNSALLSKDSSLKDPVLLNGAVRLDLSSRMQCSTCHNPHNNAFGDFLAVDNSRSGLCVQCHNKPGWQSAAHNVSAKRFAGGTKFRDPRWNSVAEYGCQSCHTPHTAGKKAQLLYETNEEQNCLGCHNGTVAASNISAELAKVSAHAAGDYTGVHDPTEYGKAVSRHAECQDCHNPHAANSQKTGDLPGALKKVQGIMADGSATSEITKEYELCFRCHADSVGKKVYVQRQYPEMNTRLDFALSNASYHPVIGKGKNPYNTMLKAPYTSESIITCTSCHNNNAGSANGGIGPKGPHGSIYPPLLERKQNFSQSFSTDIYDINALCGKCHNIDRVLEDPNGFLHSYHVRELLIPCTACHDPHGSKNNTHLINFDRSVVEPNYRGELRFEDHGRYGGNCLLQCHGEDHRHHSYY